MNVNNSNGNDFFLLFSFCNMVSNRVRDWENLTSVEKINDLRDYIQFSLFTNYPYRDSLKESLFYNFLEAIKPALRGYAIQNILMIQTFLLLEDREANPILFSQMSEMPNFLETLKTELQYNTERVTELSQGETPTSPISSPAAIATSKCQEESEMSQNDDTGSIMQSGSPTYVYENVAIHQYETNVVYGGAKSFKSLLSIAIGNSKTIKKGLYILVDNFSGKDIPRYTEALAEKAILIGLEKINKKVQEIKEHRVTNAQSASYIMCNYLVGNQSNYYLAEGIIKRCYKMFGAELDNPKPVNGFVAIEAMIDDAIRNENIDFICIDSLNKLFGGSKKIDDDKVSQLIQLVAKENITLLCVHHTNAQGKLAGTNAIVETFDNIYRLSRDTSYLTENTGEKSLILVEEYSRYSEEKSIRLKVTFGNNMNPIFEVVEELTPSELKPIQIQASQKRTNVAERIKTILNSCECDTIAFNELKTKLGEGEFPRKGAIKNSLKDLADKGYVQKTDGGWAVITILEPLKKK